MEALQLYGNSIKEVSYESDIRKVIEKIKPNWTCNQIEIKKMSGGHSCNTYLVQKSAESEKAIIFRVRKLFAEESDKKPLVKSTSEEKIVQEVSKLGLFPRVYAMFKDGYCYKYIDGTSLNSTKLDDLPLELIAEKLVKIHSVKLEDEDYTKVDFFARVKHLLNTQYPENLDIANRKTLLKELNEFEEYSKQFNFTIVLCHGDPQPGNIVWNSTKKTIDFIDWELTHIGYRALDVACFYQAFTYLDMLLNPTALATEEIQKNKTAFIKLYLENWAKINNQPSDISEEEFTEFCREVEFFSLLWPLYVVILLGALPGDFSSRPEGFLENLIKSAYTYYWELKDSKLHELKLKKTA